MKDFETQLNTLGKMAQDIRMTETEKSLVRSHIDTFIKDNPLPVQKTLPVKSPYANVFGFMSFARAVAFVLVGVILGTTGVASASLNSLPGDTLYLVKTGIVEPITGAVLATTPEAKVSYEEKLVYKRLSEVEELKTKELLDTRRTLVAQKAIAYQSERFNTALTSIETDNAALVIAKSENMSNEFRRREEMFGSENTSTTMMISAKIQSIETPQTFDEKTISDEIKIRREKLDEKQTKLRAMRIEKESRVNEASEKENEKVDDEAEIKIEQNIKQKSPTQIENTRSEILN